MITEVLDTLNVEIGETIRIDCPGCKGKNTFTVTNNLGNLIYNCYKASCNLSGKLHSTISISQAKEFFQNKKQQKEKIANEFILPDHIVLRNSITNNFTDRWDISDTLGYDVKQNRAVFFIKENNVIIDAVGRSLDARIPKWLRYGSSNKPYTIGNGNIAVIVEDCISANAISSISKNFIGVALLGTSMTEETYKYIQKFERIIVALDPDATVKTLHIAAKLRQGSKSVTSLKLQDDIKYYNFNDVNKFKQQLTEDESYERNS